MDGVIEAFRALTILPFRQRKLEGSLSLAFYLLSFTLVGLTFGLLGAIVLAYLENDLPYLAAWGVALLWLIFSGGAHFSGLSRTAEALSFDGTKEEKARLLESGAVGGAGAAISSAVFLGKVFALVQLSHVISPVKLTAVLIAPMFARYSSVLLLLADSGSGKITLKSRDRLIVIVCGLLLLILASYNSIPLFMALFVLSMLTLAVGREVIQHYLGVIKPAIYGALIEVCEMLLLVAASIILTYFTSFLLG